MIGPDGSYKYTRDLMRLNTHAHSRVAADPRFAEVRSPLILEAWTLSLRRHPDRDYVQYILGGIQNGFQIGVDDSAQQIRTCYRLE